MHATMQNYPALFSHSLRPDASTVARVPFVTTLALPSATINCSPGGQDLTELLALMAFVQLDEFTNDKRILWSK